MIHTEKYIQQHHQQYTITISSDLQKLRNSSSVNCPIRDGIAPENLFRSGITIVDVERTSVIFSLMRVHTQIFMPSSTSHVLT